jgi:hypothetical protein
MAANRKQGKWALKVAVIAAAVVVGFKFAEKKVPALKGKSS